jgi:AraC-like DNA-binding protein
MPLWEVSRRVGYQAASAFTRAFKAHYGIAPRGYAAQLARGLATTDPWASSA